MIRADLATLFQSAALSLAADSVNLPEIEILEPRDPSHGDFACNFALAASKLLGKPPRQIAEELVAAIPQSDLIASTEIAGPGFINIRLVPGVAGRYVAQVLNLGTDFVRAEGGDRRAESGNPSLSRSEREGQGRESDSAPRPATPIHPQPSRALPRINLEFVSVNPNGPITVGSGRGAAYGTTLGNVLEAAGHDVHREYYINDGVNSEQMRLFAESVQHYISRSTIEWVGRPLSEDMQHQSRLQLIDSFIQTLGPGFGGMTSSWFEDKCSSYLNQNPPTSDDAYSLLARKSIEQWLVISDHDPFRIGLTFKARYEHCYVSGEFQPYDQVYEELGYKGDYVKEVAIEIIRTNDAIEIFRNSIGDKGVSWLQSQAQRIMIELQQCDLEDFYVAFDTWFSEQSLHDSGAVDQCVQDLIEKGAADEEPVRRKLKLVKGGVIEDVLEETQDELGEGDDVGDANPPLSLDGRGSANEGSSGEGENQGQQETPSSQFVPHSPSPIKGEGKANTLWLRSTKFGDDMDRVLRRKDSRLTYIASDVAYHKDKFNRGSKPKPDGTTEKADKLITILGPDHHGYIGRLHAVVGALLEGDVGKSSASGRQVDGKLDKSSKQPANNLQTTSRQPADDLTTIDAKLYRSPAERDACLAALAEAREKLEVVIFQIVRFVKNGVPAPMRKRDGNIYSLRDLMSEIGKTAAPNEPEEEQMRIGKDVARFFYLMRSHDTHMDFDIDLATKQSDENPVFYCQYAHARICSILERAKLPLSLDGRGSANEESPGEGVRERDSESPSSQFVPHRPSPFKGEASEVLHLLTHERELSLIKKICDLPEEVKRCAEDYGVHRLTTYAQELAKTFHYFYDGCRVIQTDQPELTQARLALCEATKIGLRAVFDLLGISSPERMERTITEQ